MRAQSLGRRDVLRRGATIGLAASAATLASTGMSALGQDATPAAGGESDLETLKRNVRATYDKTKSDIDALGSDIDAGTRDVYDRLRAELDAIGDELAKAENIPHDSVHAVKRAYRDVQHKLEDLDHEAHRGLHRAEEAGHDAWHDIRKGLHDVHKTVDHVIDAL